jgi:hypothetical protein
MIIKYEYINKAKIILKNLIIVQNKILQILVSKKN